jgi:hypothetical protein
VVVALSASHGGAAETERLAAVPASAAAAAKPAGWRAWAAALFAPRVLRYVAPVLALSLVAAVSFVALRSRRAGMPGVARQARPDANAARRPSEVAETTATSNANTSASAEPNLDAPDNANASAAAAAPVARGGHGGAEGRPTVVEEKASEELPPPPAPAAPASAGTAGPAEVAKAAPQPVVADEPAPQPKTEAREASKAGRAAEPADEAASNELAAAQQQRRAANNRANEIQLQMPDGGARNQKRAADNSASGAYGGGSAAAPKESRRDENAGARARSVRRGESAEDEKRQDDEVVRVGETRSAAGHRFRREGSVWVDVNYRPSMSSTGVRRGTEAFRALVADVPEVGRVAEQFGGEVVVVVRGRAYRIR